MASYSVGIRRSFGIYSAISAVPPTSLKVVFLLFRPDLKNVEPESKITDKLAQPDETSLV
jgi:hypothetical protein